MADIIEKENDLKKTLGAISTVLCNQGDNLNNIQDRILHIEKFIINHINPTFVPYCSYIDYE